MRWRGWLAAAWATLALPVCGCLTRPSTLAALPPLPSPPAAAEAKAPPQVARAQMPDAPNPSNSAVCRLITLPVDRPADAQHATPKAAIRAVVNGDLILDEELHFAVARELMTVRTPKEKEEVLKQGLETLIDREILLQDAVSKLKRGGKQGEALLKKIEELSSEEFEKRWLRPMLKDKHMHSRDDLSAMMLQHGLSLEVIRRWWIRNFMAQQYLSSQIETLISRIGHTEISEYYENHRDEYTQPDSVEWQDIFLDASRHASPAAARQFAESLVRRVRDGEDFAKLSAEFDDGESGKFRKGEGQGHKHGEIFPHEAEARLFQMKDGDIQIIEVARGFHILRLVKRQYAGPIPFDAKVQKEIRDKLRTIVFMREKDSIVKKLKCKAVIDRYDGQ